MLEDDGISKTLEPERAAAVRSLVEPAIGSLGLELVRTKVGDRYVVEEMRNGGYNVGGEQSGHIVLSDYSTTGDGLIAALQILAVVQRQDRPVSEICHRFEPVPQVLRNVRFQGGRPLDDAHVQAAIREGEGRLDGSGRLVIRPSGTEPLIRVMGEADDAALLDSVVEDIVSALSRAAT